MLDIERLRREHVRCCPRWPADDDGDHWCNGCGNPWPCDTFRLLEVLTPDVVAVAELLALRVSPAFVERFGEHISIETLDGRVWQVWDREANTNPLCMDGTPTELLAAVTAAIGETA
jgi:hypothetical protein